MEAFSSVLTRFNYYFTLTSSRRPRYEFICDARRVKATNRLLNVAVVSATRTRRHATNAYCIINNCKDCPICSPRRVNLQLSTCSRQCNLKNITHSVCKSPPIPLSVRSLSQKRVDESIFRDAPSPNFQVEAETDARFRCPWL